MNIGLIITLVAILLVLLLSYSVMLQHKVRSEVVKKQKSTRYTAIINSTEDLIGNSHYIPFSKKLLICLNKRILYALQNMLTLDPKNKELIQHIENIMQQISQLKDEKENVESTSFKNPTNDKQAIIMLKLVKRLRDVIRNENNKGRLQTRDYLIENTRLETIQTRISIENIIKRTHTAIIHGQAETAIQLITKALDTLNSKNDTYSNQARKKLQIMFSELKEKHSEKKVKGMPEVEIKERQSDMEALFGQKKKW
ncbi:outer-membrane lipoprotein carrier protein [Candidatus Photodesmus blepharus]|uniref:Outer-membrane lipoprotein carrier protein n=1 Tax=Candidatus Photodesmus blepharonis TaxID=1179155 RepID=A0A084CMB4_9GAMM|nr:hypothetical protein [Candidatus Photodesmus blepharus]KEY90943.1 outer-membrane lipoprotein carrier protein [Candidatus Photodesmus blepharus]